MHQPRLRNVPSPGNVSPYSLFFAIALLCVSVAGAQISVSAPATASAGAPIQISWVGGGDDGDFVSIDTAGAPHRDYGSYVYAKKGSPQSLEAPDEPGSYEIRYHLKSTYEVVATAPLKVTDVTATIDTPSTVGAGSEITVTWQGPDNPRDFISVDPAGEPERSYGHYVYTKKGSPVTLPAPNQPGEYEVRYHMGKSYRVLGRSAVTVSVVSATLEAPTRVAAGSQVTVSWSGPGGRQDFLSVDEVGAPEASYGRYVYLHDGSPVTISAPDDPGEYVLRYHLGGTGYPVIGSSPLTVGKVSASVSAPSEVTAGEPFEINWDGPDNLRDYVTIVPVGTKDGEYGPYGYTQRGNPVRVQAPKEPGIYVVRYQTGQTNRVLATATTTTTVVPGASTGHLRVMGGESPDTGRPAGAVEVILDASGSMLQRIDNRRRIELAREALVSLTGSALPEGVPFALRVFGHREAGSCRTDLEIPLAPLNRAEAAARIQSVESKNLAKTPIAASLAKVREDLAGVDGPHLVILVTDGEETCDGDPAAAIDALRKGGIEVRVNIVGFAIGDLATREDFERWARRGGGSYSDASNGDDLARAVREALRPPYEVLANGEVVATGIVDGQALELPVGRYDVRLLSSPPRDLGSVEVTPDQEVRVDSDGG